MIDEDPGAGVAYCINFAIGHAALEQMTTEANDRFMGLLQAPSASYHMESSGLSVQAAAVNVRTSGEADRKVMQAIRIRQALNNTIAYA